MIYIAGKFTSQARLRGERTRLQGSGFVVRASWLDETATDYNAPLELKMENASRDCDEVGACTTFVLDTLDVSETGGREVELGMALQRGNVTIFRVGPPRNVFHYLIPDGWTFPDWETFHQNLAEFS